METRGIVHIVDDDEAVQRSLAWLLDAAGFDVTIYESPSVLLAAAAALVVGCIVLDVRMSEMSGLELQARLIDIGIFLPVIIITGQGDIPTAVKAMRAGAVDFIEKPFNEATIVAAIKTAIARGRTQNRDRELSDAVHRMSLLSRRERQVLDGLIAGRSNKVIAYDLAISVRTVEVHRARMMVRLGVHQLSEAIRIAVMAQFASPEGGSQAPLI